MMNLLHNLRVPVIQAPMSGGINNPTFAAAVMEAGGIGSFGFGFQTNNENIIDVVKNTQAKSCGPIQVNFFELNYIERETRTSINFTSQKYQKVVERLKSICGNVLNDQALNTYSPPNLEKNLEPIWSLRPALLSFHFGIPSDSIIEKAKNLGIFVGVTGTSLEEALLIEQSGADFIILQGIEAGGHRGTFAPLDEKDEKLSIFDLLRQVKGRFSIPLIASGGIMTGHDIHQAIQLGASAVQMGTAFLCCKESTAPLAHKRYILDGIPREVAMTSSFTGRYAQGFVNDFILKYGQHETLPYPFQHILTSSIRAEAQRLDDGEYQSLWVGTNYQRSKGEITVKELMDTLHAEYAQCLIESNKNE